MSTSHLALKESGPPPEKMPGHWLLAQAGKRVPPARWSGIDPALARSAPDGPSDEVVEFAPGLGVTAKLTLGRHPRRYTAGQRDPVAAEQVRRLLAGPDGDA